MRSQTGSRHENSTLRNCNRDNDHRAHQANDMSRRYVFDRFGLGEHINHRLIGNMRPCSPTSHDNSPNVRPQLGPYTRCKAFSPGLRNITWQEKFKPSTLKSFDGTKNPSEFLQIYTTIVQTAGNDEKEMANYLSTMLKGSARTWLFNQPNSSIYSWENLCHAIQNNFKSCYTKLRMEDDLHCLQQISDKKLMSVC